jgi:hypothetical protein
VPDQLVRFVAERARRRDEDEFSAGVGFPGEVARDLDQILVALARFDQGVAQILIERDVAAEEQDMLPAIDRQGSDIGCPSGFLVEDLHVLRPAAARQGRADQSGDRKRRAGHDPVHQRHRRRIGSDNFLLGVHQDHRARIVKQRSAVFQQLQEPICVAFRQVGQILFEQRMMVALKPSHIDFPHRSLVRPAPL